MYDSSIFKHPSQQAQMDAQGYTTFDLLPEAKCRSLLHFYTDHPYQNDDRAMGISTALDQTNKNDSLNTAQHILNLIQSFVENHLHHFQVIIATFIVKGKGTYNITPLHQDWTFVDEKRYNSYNLWCPLQEVSLQNGALGILPGSHQLLGNEVRPSPSPPYVPVFRESAMELFEYLHFLHLRAGEAVLFDHRCWHGAMPNNSETSRVAIGLCLAHKSATLEHHYLLPGTQKVGIFAVDKHFYYAHGNKELQQLHSQGLQPNSYDCVSTYDFEQPNVSASQLMEQIRANASPNEKVRSLLRDLFSPQPTESISSTSKSSFEQSESSSQKPLWKVYTPRNIYLEIKHRLSRKSTEKESSVAETTLQEEGLSTQRTSDAAAAVGAFYDTQHEAFIEVYGAVIQAFRTKKIDSLLNYELQSIGLRAEEVVLDAGCGVCGPAIYFSRRVPCLIHAITISERQYKQANRVLQTEEQQRVRLYLGDFHYPTKYFKREMFDRIYFLESFGHSSEKKQLLAACWEVLKPGGVLYIKDLFRRIAPPGLSQQRIDALISSINASYCYEVSELTSVLHTARQLGYILQFVKAFDISPDQFEDLSISNHFQDLTGVNRTEDWKSYVFPVDFIEIRMYKPIYSSEIEKDKHYLQKILRKSGRKLSATYV